MLKVGITGGIGSGKTTVTRMFSLLQVPILRADDLAKMLMQTDPQLKASIIVAFGPHIYGPDGSLQREQLAAAVFGKPEQVAKLNGLVHPAVIAYGKQWMKENGHFTYAIKEAALFFESGSYRDMDIMVGVYAPRELRLQRALRRDRTAVTEIEKRMKAQLDEEEKMKRCQYIIYNDDSQLVIPQVLALHQRFMEATA